MHMPKAAVLDQWRSTLFLRDAGLNARGWLPEVMRCVEAIGRPGFTLADVYAFEPRLAALYPATAMCGPRSGSSRQVLRDPDQVRDGRLAFNGSGTYRRV